MHLKKLNPDTVYLEYKLSNLFEYIDNMPDLALFAYVSLVVASRQLLALPCLRTIDLSCLVSDSRLLAFLTVAPAADVYRAVPGGNTYAPFGKKAIKQKVMKRIKSQVQ